MQKNSKEQFINNKEFETFLQILCNKCNQERDINFDNDSKIGEHILNLFKSKKSNWNDIALMGHCLIDVSLGKAETSITNTDSNSLKLKQMINLQREHLKNSGYFTKSLMLLSSVYHGKPLEEINVDISKSDMISANLRNRFNILEKYGFKCIYCGRSPPEVCLQLEHINPKSNGGKDIESNFAPACFECNSGKSNKIIKKLPEEVSNEKGVQSV